MELEITPEPPPEEREAVEEALARLLAEPKDPRSAWWRLGVRENLFGAEGEGAGSPPANAAPPRPGK